MQKFVSSKDPHKCCPACKPTPCVEASRCEDCVSLSQEDFDQYIISHSRCLARKAASMAGIGSNTPTTGKAGKTTGPHVVSTPMGRIHKAVSLPQPTDAGYRPLREPGLLVAIETTPQMAGRGYTDLTKEGPRPPSSPLTLPPLPTSPMEPSYVPWDVFTKFTEKMDAFTHSHTAQPHCTGHVNT